MRCGLYGKLPAKRDFIAIATPRDFLAVWEPWLQGGISASRMKLSAGWQQAFLRAPIWRFWLGQDLCGGAVLGALMPSVDGVGRYFPLTIFALADPGEDLPPPEIDAHDAWLTEAEDLLLSALAEGADFEALSEAVGQLRSPMSADGAGQGAPSVEHRRLHDGTVIAPAEPGALGTVLADLRKLDHSRSYGQTTVWWTAGGDDFPPQVMVGRRMPDPYLFAGLLTGRFDEAL